MLAFCSIVYISELPGFDSKIMKLENKSTDAIFISPKAISCLFESLLL